MPFFECKCGARIDMGSIPNPNEWLIISDDLYDKYSGAVDAEELYKDFLHMIKCSSCGGLHIFWDGMQFPATFYKSNSCPKV